MAQRVLGRAPHKHTPTHHLGLYRIASHATGRRYRAACRRAERYARLLHMGRHMAFIWTMFRQSLWPLRHLFDLALYALAGAGILLREWRADGHEHVFEQEEDFRQIAWRLARKRSHARLNTAVGFLCVTVFFFTLSTYGIGLEVIMDGESIGFVASQSVFENSLDTVSARASEILGHTYTVRPDVRFRFSLVKRDRIFNSREVEDSLLAAIPEIDTLNVLRVDGEVVGASRSAAAIQAVLDDILSAYPLPSEARNPEFVQSCSIEHQLASLTLLKSEDSLQSLLTSPVRDEQHHVAAEGETAQDIAQAYGISLESLYANNPGLRENGIAAGQTLLTQRAKPLLSVRYTVMVTHEEALPYKTEYIANHALWEGESETITEGRDGVNLLIEKHTVIDGYPPTVEQIGSYIGTAPVTELIATGNRTRITTGVFIRPFSGPVTSPYGYRKLFNQMHSGTDFRGNIGELIYASDGGTVSFAGVRGTFGKLVVIDHENGYQTYYAHCSELLVKEGQVIGQGEAISKIGNTGRSTGPHLHFEIRLNGVSKDPMKFLSTGSDS